MIIEQPSIWLHWLYPRATWRMDRHVKAVYLTFDDGPIPEATPIILKILADYDIKATFFMVGDNIHRHPELLEAVLEAGHRVGNHTYNHISGFRHSVKRYNMNAERANQYLHTNLFRPPHGWMQWHQYFWLGKRYRIVMWDLLTRDYSKWITAEDIVNNVKNFARNGSIIPCHDSLKSIEKLKTALPESIEWLKEQGYEFKVFE